MCAYYGDVSAIRFVLGRGESLATLGPDLGLNGAAFHGHWQLCQFLLENGASANSALPDTGAATLPGVETDGFMRDCCTRGETPVHRAAAFGSADTIEMLLAAGAAKDRQDAHGDSPLCWASWYRRPAAILRLLCYGPFSVRASYQGLRVHLVRAATRGWVRCKLSTSHARP